MQSRGTDSNSNSNVLQGDYLFPKGNKTLGFIKATDKAFQRCYIDVFLQKYGGIQSLVDSKLFANP